MSVSLLFFFVLFLFICCNYARVRCLFTLYSEDFPLAMETQMRERELKPKEREENRKVVELMLTLDWIEM